MNRTMIMSMSDTQYKKIFDDLLFDDPDFFTNISKGHSLEEHMNKKDYELLSRANFKEDNNGFVSSFTTREEFTENMQNAISYKMDDITDWVMKKRSEFDSKDDFEKFAFTVDLKPDPVGYGFRKNDLTKYETTAIRIVLSRDYSDESPLGFYMSTAYPDMSKATPAKKLTIEDVENSKSFSTIEKLYFKAQDMGLRAKYKIYESEESLKISIPEEREPNNKMYVYFTENDYNIKEVSEDKEQKRTRIDTATMLFKNSKEGNKVLQLETYKRKLLKDAEIGEKIPNKNTVR